VLARWTYVSCSLLRAIAVSFNREFLSFFQQKILLPYMEKKPLLHGWTKVSFLLP